MNLKAQGLEHAVKDNKSFSGQATDATTSAMTIVEPDFKSIIDYNSTIHEIVSILRYCGHPVTDEQMIEKTLTTFHASNILLQEQYRERGFKKFNELMSVLLVAEQNSDLLLKNHNLRPNGSLATHHEANATSSYPPEANAARRGGRGNYNSRGRSHGNYRGRGQGRGRNNFQRNSNLKKFEKQKGQSSGTCWNIQNVDGCVLGNHE
ncbi:uncharacterized protein LOC110707487 [Chenopodium quinoa]|uniref:uncharacterized protein LOC110707487 n=1 Tax=Chenopodium quinoa TaxID=63459 RepID=UPI000B7789AB|nr:uncharacterized protein LOC110707487 [Chenopodium quinoa]